MGVDRLVMVLAGKDAIRDVIAFPKSQSGTRPAHGRAGRGRRRPAARARPRLDRRPAGAHGRATCPSGTADRGRRAPRGAHAPAIVRGVRRPGAPRRARDGRSRASCRGARCPRSSCGVRPGTGKTTLAHLLADAVGAQLVQLSAVNSGVADARKVMDGARGGLFRTVLFVDEVHRWSKAQQDVLLPAVEEGTVTLIGATTENPYFSLNTPLLSRCLLLRLEPLDDEAVADRCCGARSTTPTAASDAPASRSPTTPSSTSSTIAGGDARMALTGLEAAAEAARAADDDRDHAARSPPTRCRRRRSSTTARATRTTTSSARSSSRSAAPTPTPRCSGSPA